MWPTLQPYCKCSKKFTKSDIYFQSLSHLWEGHKLQLPGISQKPDIILWIGSSLCEANQIDAIFLHCQSGRKIVTISLVVTIVETIPGRHIKTWDINNFVRYESHKSVTALELLYFVISPWPTDGPKCSSNKSVQRLSNLFFSLTRSLYFPAPFWLQLILRKCLQKRKPPTTTNFLQNMNNITSDVRLL